MKIYTRTGDQGQTGLFGGERVAKDDARVRAYGAVDEASAAVGVACASADLPAELKPLLLDIMSDLFDVGAELATPPSALHKLGGKLDSSVNADRAAALERLIDAVDAEVPPLAAFVLPTGTDAAARLHVARTGVRRAEREIVSLARDASVRGDVIVYVNRLSDLLFAWSRLCNHRAGVGDIPWRARK
ncbi:MAG TPA: cob(I)yrinic acid a,c-diamide adenosyltransferase [Myxococcota bacterium]|jgi:cob(I)alamin adenosyltransferase